jgi:glycosyltransferase involved in cell wall biosynthesis
MVALSALKALSSHLASPNPVARSETRRPRVVLVANTSWYLYNFRLSLLHDLASRGLDVQLLAPADEHTELLKQEGFCVHPWQVNRRSINPWLEAKAQLDLLRHYQKLQPDLVHHFTIKACLYGTVAAKAAGVPRVINAVTGLGHLFLAERKRARLLRKLVKIPYRAAFSARRSTVVFQNAADQELLVKLGLVERNRTSVIRSSGVDLSRFQPPSRQRLFRDPPVLLFPSRLIREKGIAELLQAIQLLRRQQLTVHLWIAGALDHGNRSALSADELDQLQQQPGLRLLGHVNDMPALYADADIVVLPSWREGLSKALIEAAAMEKPIITADVPGCRDVVDHGVSGLLVPPRNVAALALAIRLLVHQPELAQRLGRAARKKVAEEFAVTLVNQRTYATYCQLLGLPAP